MKERNVPADQKCSIIASVAELAEQDIGRRGAEREVRNRAEILRAAVRGQREDRQRKTGLRIGDANQYAGSERAAQVAGRHGDYSSVQRSSLGSGKASFAIADEKIDCRTAFGGYSQIKM